MKKTVCKCTNATVETLLAMVLSLGKRHSLSWVVIEDIMTLFSTILDSNDAKVSKYKLQKLFEKFDYSKNHYYCKDCDFYIGETKVSRCSECSSQNVGDYIMFDFRAVINKFLGRKIIQDNILCNRPREEVITIFLSPKFVL